MKLRVAWLSDPVGNLLISTGERADGVTRLQAQLLTSGLEKISRITKEGMPTAGNPLAARAGAHPEVYIYGHRNPQGLAIHLLTGDLWQSEHGPRSGDEINRIQPGANYGWPTITYGIDYNGQRMGKGCSNGRDFSSPFIIGNQWSPPVG